MRPEFGCRIHDFVFASADGATANAIAAEVRRGARTLGAADRRPGRRSSASTRSTRRSSTSTSATRIRRSNDRRNLVFPFYVIPGERLRDEPLDRPVTPADGTRQPERTDDGPPVPNLDDRRFQDLVDDAKRLVQQRCPEWTDHNVSDPGVTLIELFAWMTDQLLYRLNRVPDRNYVKFLELIGVTLFPPTAARTQVTFWLSAPAARRRPDPGRHAGRDRPHRDRRGDRLRDHRGPADRPVERWPSSARWSTARRTATTGRPSRRAPGSTCFKDVPAAGRRALRRPVRGGAIECRPPPLQLPHRGRRRRPERTRRWPGRPGAARTGSRASSTRTRPAASTATATSSSTSRASHVASLIAKQRAGWLRARVTEPVEGQPAYSASPSITGLSRDHDRRHGGRRQRRARAARKRSGSPSGISGQRFALKRRAGRAIATSRRSSRSRARTAGRSGRRSPDFAGSGPTDHHFALDLQLRRGPARARRPAGRRHAPPLRRGARQGRPAPPSRVPDRRRPEGQRLGRLPDRPEVVDPVRRPRREPPPGSRRRRRRGHRERQGPRPDPAPDARPGGHDRGLRAPRPRGGAGGRPGPGRRRRRRGRCRLRPRARRPDGERIGGLAPVRPAGAERRDAPEDHRPPRGDPRHRHAGNRRAAGLSRGHRRREAASAARARTRHGSRRRRSGRSTPYFHPIAGGPEEAGWPFGRPVNVGEVYSVLQSLRGTELVEDARLFGADPVTGQRGQQTTSASSSSRTRSSSATSTRSWSRAPDRCAARSPGCPPRTRWVRRCPPSTRRTQFAQRFMACARHVVLAPVVRTLDNFDCVPRPVSDAGRLPRLARELGRRSRSTRCGRASAGGRRWPGRSSCTGCAARRRASASRSRSTPAGPSRSSRTAGRPGRSTRAASCRAAPSRSSWCGSTWTIPKEVDAARVDALVAAAKPAHVEHRVEIVKAAARKSGT